jgi:diguanylate cyclase (GGDEF)-like protein/PAS domain S-box-containing protein
MPPNATSGDLVRLPGRPDLGRLAEAALESSYDSVLITGPDLDRPEIVYVNPAFCLMTGYRRDEVIGRTPALLQGPDTDHRVTRRLRNALEAGRSFEGRTVNYRKDGSPFHIEWRTSPVLDRKDRVTHYLAIQRDVTAQVRRMERLRERAELDGLTELFNHEAGSRRLEHEMSKARKKRRPLSVTLLDIDRFKAINDEHGHAQGDLVLQRLGRLITQRLQRKDVAMRWGGEEFLLVLLDTGAEAAVSAAESFRQLIAETDFHDDITVTASFGVAEFDPQRDDSVDALFRRADAALYRAKAEGRNRVAADR